MKKIITWMAWTSVGLVAALAALNWPALLAPTTINVGFSEVESPLGLLLLGLLGVPLALCFVASLHQQISVLMEARDLLKVVQRAHELADKAEASRVEGLRQLVTDQFRVIDERLDSLGAAPSVGRYTPARPNGLWRTLAGPRRADAGPL